MECLVIDEEFGLDLWGVVKIVIGRIAGDDRKDSKNKERFLKEGEEIMRVLDSENNNFVDIHLFVSCLTLLSSLKYEEKMMFLFNVFDFNK